MIIAPNGHLTYCTNIHPGESWDEVFNSLKEHLPLIKAMVSPETSMGIGLRLSNQASIELSGLGTGLFRSWLEKEGFYVFTLNGFPYGGFHGEPVKDRVHQPDWTTRERVDYTLQLFDILAELLPAGMDGGISTSPLSYKPWLQSSPDRQVFRRATDNLLQIVQQLHRFNSEKSILMHLDIEPEPDGLIENSQETVDYFQNWLVPAAQKQLSSSLGVSPRQAKEILLRHIKICYDVCHFAIEYESPEKVMHRFSDAGIGIGKIQISAALKRDFPMDSVRDHYFQAFSSLNEPTYLHQVVARDSTGNLHQYPDLPTALEFINDPQIEEWRTHFHVPVFVESYGVLQSTQNDIVEVLSLWQDRPMTGHLEVETYTWEVLPSELQTEITSSIARELLWVKDQLHSE